MMKHSKIENGYICRLEKGEEFLTSLTQFCIQENITSAIFNAIGAVENAELGFYHLGSKKYQWRRFESTMEIASLTGNVALVDNNPLLHIHCVLSNENFETFGGHLKEADIGATCEVFLTKLEVEIKRHLDDEVGLQLLDLD